MSQKSAKDLRHIHQNNLNLYRRLIRLEADVRELQADRNWLLYQAHCSCVNSRNFNRELSIMSMEQRKWIVSRRRIGLLIGSATIIMCLIGLSLRIFKIL